MSWSDGQKLAREQLEDIEAAARGHLSIEEVVDPPDEASRAKIVVSLTTAHLKRALGGLPFKAREKFVLLIPRGFPFGTPSVYAAHKRWAGFPHVQWGNYLCLYRSINIEYAPSDGMFGIIERLNVWLAAGALGQLDPDDAPLHPPSVAVTTDECVVIYANAPKVAGDNWHWVGAAHLRRRNQRRLDLKAWTSLDGDFPVAGEGETIAAAIILNRPLPFEYPTTVRMLVLELVAQDFAIDFLIKFMRLYAISLPDGAPLYFVIGAPMRRRETGAGLKAHLAVWRVDAAAAKALRLSLYDERGGGEDIFYSWAAKAGTIWCNIHEARDEVTFRRDMDSRASWFKDKKVLLLGCGAIGSQVGEYAVRAGAGRLDLVDNGVVTPGVLMRQNFTDDQIGFAKARALEARLMAISPSVTINVNTNNLALGMAPHFPLSDFDLIVDATASNSVSTVLEREMQATAFRCPLVSLTVSARAEYGMAMVHMPHAVGGPLDLARRAKLAMLRNKPNPFAAAFWPKREDIKLFQPEPGCSEPTFVGSAIDIAAHSSVLLNLALERITTLGASASSADCIVLPTLPAKSAKMHEGLVFEPPIPTLDARYGYRVLIDPVAKREMLSWIARNKRVRDVRVETGGLIFGAIDESLKTIWLDRVSGPPLDSEASEEQFLCGVAGTRELTEHHIHTSAGSVGFIGIWHTHPVSRPEPSIDDLKAMLQLLVMEKEPPRHVLMVIVGFAAGAPRLATYLFRRREFQPLIMAARGER